MRRIQNLILFFGFFLGVTSCSNIDVNDRIIIEAVDPLFKVFRENSYFPSFVKAEADVARGEFATLQFAVRSNFAIHSLQVSVENARLDEWELPVAEVGYVGYVSVERIQSNPSRDRLSSLSGYYPDPILPETEIDVRPGETQPVWVSIPVPKDATPGKYSGKVIFSGKLEGKSFSIEKDYTVNVFQVVVNKPRLLVTNWFGILPSFIHEEENIDKFSDKYWDFVKALAVILSSHCNNVPYVSFIENLRFEWTGSEWQIDFSHFDKMVEIFKEAGGMDRIEGSHIAWYRENPGHYELTVPELDKEGKVVMKYYPLSDRKTKDFYRFLMPAFQNHLKEKGWDKIYMQHISDEPHYTLAKKYAEVALFIKSIVPEMKLIDAMDGYEVARAAETSDFSDVWVPMIHQYDMHQDFYREQQKEGDELWFYTCMWPQDEYANRFLELPLLKTRYIHWLNFKYNATGYLHWGLNWWKENKTGGPFSETTEFQARYGVALPGGDIWIIYPYKGELIGSIRLDAMRDGIFDHELLKMYEEKEPEKAKELCNRLVQSFTGYDMSILSFRQARRELLQGLSN